MEWIADPTVWVGLATLVALEIVLGVDNLIFIAILSDKLPAGQRDRARILGLSLALVMRLALLGSITWVMSLTTPLFGFWGFEVSWRDLILIAGGLFLLVKATTEIHDRLEQRPHAPDAASHSGFWAIVAQIVVLDAVFSLDSIITAVGMVDELYVMMAAVVIAVLTMLFASKPLTAFISKRPSLIILCLGFLLMVGLVLVLDGFGLHVPKGYLYAAIGFSLMIEVLNQLATRRKTAPGMSARRQVADAVLRILGGVPLPAYAVPEGQVFGAAEQQMVGGVLSLGERPVSTVMTPRSGVTWLDMNDPDVLAKLREDPHREFPVGRGSIDKVEGVVRKEDVLGLRVDGKPIDLAAVLRPAPSVRVNATVLDALNQFKRHTAELAIVVNAQGRFEGIVTRTDLLEAIAGEFPDEGE
jgi:predicted tellurium resistance membrane protein TerC